MIKRVITVCFAILLGISLTACGSASGKSEAVDMAAPSESGVSLGEETKEPGMNAYALEDGLMTESVEEGTAESPQSAERKLIKTVDLDVETKEFDKLLLTLEKQIKETGGYIEYLDSSGSLGRSASITARIPVVKLDGFVKQIGESANITSRSESVEDVTLQYVDMDSHVRMLEEEQERLLELLETASTIEDMITIETRLGEVRYQLESMKSQLRVFDNQVEYSTVHIQISEVVELTPAAELTAGERIAQGFSKSMADVLYGIREFFINLVINLPFIIVWAIVIAIILLIVHIIIKTADKRSSRLQLKRQQQMHLQNDPSVEKRTPFVQKPGTFTEKEKKPGQDERDQ